MQAEKNIWLSMLSMLLTLALLIACVPNQVYALACEALADLLEQEAAESIETPNEIKHGVYEVTELREANVKHFALEDGTYTAVMYGSAVHTQGAEGNWQDIDNRLEASGSEFSTSNARIKFAKKITGNEALFTLHDGNRKITMFLNDAIKKTTGVVTNHTTEFGSEATQLQKLMTLDNLSSEILYANILDGVDLQYVVESLNVKENIIVKEQKDSYQYTFTIALNNLEAEMVEDGSVRIYDPSTKETVYTIPTGFMYDANGECSTAVVYTLSNGGNGKYSLTVAADAAWINAADRVFPVVVDPTISPAYSANSFDATFISSSAINASNNDLGYLQAGTNSIAYWRMHTLPTLPEGYYITDASFIAQRYGTNSPINDIELGVYQVISDWDVDTFCYSQYTSQGAGQHAEYACDAGIGSNQSYQFIWDITQIVRSWYNDPTSNYGIAIRCPNTSTSILSYRFSLGTKALPIRITYKPIIGLEDYWSYATQSVGMAGTGYVNKATGELTFAIGTLSTSDALFGFTTALVYNQAYAGKHVIYDNFNVPTVDPTCGYGMKLNVNESLMAKSYVDIFGDVRTYYIWTDEDGTEHEFYPHGDSTSVYKDSDGLLLTLTVNGSVYEIEDMNHNIRTFTNSNLDRTKITGGVILQSITDKYGNKLNYTYLSDGKISQIQIVPNNGSAITCLEYQYNSHGQVKQISNYNASTAPKVKFYYSTNYSSTTSISQDNKGYLRKIEFINQNQVVATTSYKYSSSGKLTEVRDNTSGYYVKYTYSGNRVATITEYAGSNNTQGQKISFSYRNSSTEIRSSGSDDQWNTNDDIISVYVFDGFGRTISTYSTDPDRTIIYGASSGEYETQENVKNNVKVSTTMGGVANNYLFNGGFEKITSSKAVGWESTNVSFNSTNIDLYENYSAEVKLASVSSANLKQYVQLPKGRYTLSFDTRTYQTPDATFKVYIAPASDETSIIAQHEVPVNKYYSSNGFVTQSLHFDTTEYTTDKFVVVFQIARKSGTSYSNTACITFDNVLLEESLGHSAYNLIQFGSFDNFCRTKTGSLSVDVYEYWSTGGVRTQYDSLMGNVLQLSHNGSTNTHIATQDISTARNNNEHYEKTTFILSGMAKGTQQYASGFFGMVAKIFYQDNTREVIPFEFEYTCTEWQYLSGVFVTQAKPISAIAISLVYENPGQGYFDNIYLTRVIDESTVLNEYDENGRVIVRKNGYYEEIYEYDADNNVTRMANDRGELYDYQYNSTGMLVKTTYCSYTTLDGERNYPQGVSDPNSLIQTMLLTKTEYTYNRYGQLLSTTSYDAALLSNADNIIKSSYTYNTTAGSRLFGALLSETDELGVETKYFYDDLGQLLAVINTSTKTGTCYTYDLLGNITSVTPATWTSTGGYVATTNKEKIEYTYNDGNLLEELKTETTTYHFSYDVFGKQDSIGVGTQNNTIVQYVYNNYNGKVKEIHYANGFVVKYAYDELENISEVRYTTEGSQTSTLAYTYAYDAYGQLYRFDNKLTGTSIIYRYDTNRKLVGFVEFDDATNTNKFSATILYGDNAQVSEISYSMDYMSRNAYANCNIVYAFLYDGDGTLRDYELESAAVSGVVNFIYDDFKRITTKTYDFDFNNNTSSKFINTVKYQYQTNNENTSTQVYKYTSEIDNKGSSSADVSVTYTYTYDDRGNVTKIQTSTGQEFRYVYDDLGQLLREDNTALGKTFMYTYDVGGNILYKKVFALTAAGTKPLNPTQTYTYGYGDANWGDKLTSFNSASFTYDANGNPTAYNNGTAWAFTWIHGSRLSTAVGNGTTITFAYNDDGIRTEKTVGTIKHTYTLNGAQIVSETWGNHLAIYLYDIDGMPIGMQYRNRTYPDGTFDVYWFERNLQGDILAVYNQSGTKLISYTYDAWGNVTTTYHNGCTSTSAANYNPFRYRGYYYDVELQMYYLQTRYYDPAIGRFLNADAYIASDSSVLGCNMFAYCGNNPVMGYDPTGEFSWGKLFSGASLLAVGITACAAALTVVTAGACTPLLVAATVTFAAGGMTVLNGAAEVIESGTDYNFMRDGVMGGDEEFYEAQKNFFSNVAEIGTMVITMGSASGKLCFAAGTVVLLNEGRKAIEDIVVGDYVWAWDEETGEKSLRRVTETYVNQTSELVHVFVGGEEIVTTPTHPFYSPVKGWTDAAQLRAGDILVLVNGEYVVVEKVQHEILESPINVYNFQVAGDHTYYVSDIGVLVHNGCTQNHHVISNKHKTYTPKFKEITDRFGLNLADDWNIISLKDHSGRHTNAYHEYILERITDIANKSANADEFLQGFQVLVDTLWSNPRIPYM